MCPDRERLLNSYAEAMATCSVISRIIDEPHWQPDTDKAIRNGHKARLDARNALFLLERHTVLHGCGARQLHLTAAS